MNNTHAPITKLIKTLMVQKWRKKVEFCCDLFSEEVQLSLTNLTCRSQGSDSHCLVKEPKKQVCTLNAAAA